MSFTRRELLATGLALGIAVRARAAVSILQLQAAPLLVLLDEERLDKPMLSRLAAQGFRAELQPVPDCAAVDFALLTSRLQQARRIIGLLGPANHVLVMEALRFVGASVQIDMPGARIPESPGTRDLLLLREALGLPSAEGLQAIAATLGD